MDVFFLKLGLVCNPNRPMLLSLKLQETATISLVSKKIFLEIKCKIVQCSNADMKYDKTAAADVTETENFKCQY